MITTRLSGIVHLEKILNVVDHGHEKRVVVVEIRILQRQLCSNVQR